MNAELIDATKEMCISQIEMLLSNTSADPKAKGEDGKSAIDIANASGNQILKESVMSHSSEANAADHENGGGT